LLNENVGPFKEDLASYIPGPGSEESSLLPPKSIPFPFDLSADPILT
jgi:hypothetical protein